MNMATPALDQRAYLETLRLDPGVALRLRENARYSPAMVHVWVGSLRICSACGLTEAEVTGAPEVVVCLGERVRAR
jgi:hypothetical protein